MHFYSCYHNIPRIILSHWGDESEHSNRHSNTSHPRILKDSQNSYGIWLPITFTYRSDYCFVHILYTRIIIDNDCLRLLELPTHVILRISSGSRQTKIISAFPKITALCYQPRLGFFSTGTSITLCHEKHTFNSSILRYINLVFEALLALPSYESWYHYLFED